MTKKDFEKTRVNRRRGGIRRVQPLGKDDGFYFNSKETMGIKPELH